VQSFDRESNGDSGADTLALHLEIAGIRFDNETMLGA
jgi:hypothetical protein